MEAGMKGETQEIILKELAEGVLQFDEDRVKTAAQKAITEGLDPLVAIQEGLVRGMNRVGELFQKGEYFVPEVLICADSLYAGLDILKPHLQKGKGIQKIGKVLIGTIEGDVHEIGKSLVSMMMDIGGFSVTDLGVDISLHKFLSAHKEERFDIIAISALMSTTMLKMPEFIREIKKADPKVFVMIGGAPISRELAQKFGADGYAEDAQGAVLEAKKILHLQPHDQKSS
jgi:corrinoid protein of di/trimethylamine methyltransferase